MAAIAARTWQRHVHIGKLALCLGVAFFTCASALAQTEKTSSALSDRTTSEANEVTVEGCVSSGMDRTFYLTDAQGYVYLLTGHISAVGKHVGAEVSIQGVKNESTDGTPSLAVSSVTRIFKAPDPKLSSLFTDSANWHTHTSLKYGVKFAMPEFPSSLEVSEQSIQPNFAAEHGTVTLGKLYIPREIYPDTNFVGGSLAISVNPELTNEPSCEQFGRSDSRFRSSYTTGGIKYAQLQRVGVATGTVSEMYYFHTFRNGRCYELAFELQEFNTSYQDLGCRVPSLQEKDEKNLIEHVIKKVSFDGPFAIVRTK